MPKLDLSKAPVKSGTIYPAPYDQRVKGRTSQRLGAFGGLTQFGVNLVRLEPGAASSMRHWHLKEDEFVLVTNGPLTLHSDAGETVMETGDAAAFPAGDTDAHRFTNHTDEPPEFLVVGTSIDGEEATYPDDDLKVRLSGGTATFTHHDGTPLGRHDT